MARDIASEVASFQEKIAILRKEIGRMIVGQREVIDGVILCLLADGQVLLEGVPGLGKTMLVRTLSEAIDCQFNRIQFTPDMMPSDITGTNMIVEDERGNKVFEFQKGPVFTNILLADEINRATPKTQAALLEAMQEKSVTVGGHTYKLEAPFFVMATQNPLEMEGTYPLPEAQIDRFMFKLIVSYPSRQDELLILRRMAQVHPASDITPVLSPDELRQLRLLLDEVLIEDKVQEYIVDLVAATRDPAACGLDDLAPLIRFGASPRATIMLALAARANALMQQRNYTTPNDVKAVAMDILRHRVAVTYEAEAEDISPDHIVQKILDSVRVP